MGLSKFKKMLSEEIPNDEEEYYSSESNKTSSGKMILLEPRAYSESQQIADYLKNKNTVVVNMKRVTPDQAKRIVDFLSGETLREIDYGILDLSHVKDIELKDVFCYLEELLFL